MNRPVHGLFDEHLIPPPSSEEASQLHAGPQTDSSESTAAPPEDDNLTLGYVTHDSCPGEGDDTPHKPLQIYPLPVHVASLSIPPTFNPASFDSDSASSERDTATTPTDAHPDFPLGPSSPASLTSLPDSTPIDLIFATFLTPYIIGALNKVQKEVVYSAERDVGVYSEIRMSEVLGRYVGDVWGKEKGKETEMEVEVEVKMAMARKHDEV
jgi:hypothetical protein